MLKTGIINKSGELRKLQDGSVTWLQKRSISFPWHKKKTVETETDAPREEDAEKRTKVTGHDMNFMEMTLNNLANKRKLLTNRNAYVPPEDVNERMRKIVEQACDTTQQDWLAVSLAQNHIKYKVLTQMMNEFKHDIACATLTDIKTVADAVEYFNKEVKITAAIEDMTKLKLPPNLNIQLEAIRFDKNRDTFFGGVSAMPGRDTHVESIKFKRKYNSIISRDVRAGYAHHYYDY